MLSSPQLPHSAVHRGEPRKAEAVPIRLPFPPGQLPQRVPSPALHFSNLDGPLLPPWERPLASSRGPGKPGKLGGPEVRAGGTLQPTAQKGRCPGLKEGPWPSSGTWDRAGGRETGLRVKAGTRRRSGMGARGMAQGGSG